MMFVAYPAEADDQTLLLSVEINGYTTGKIGEFVDRDGVLLSRPEELHDLGFKLPEALAAGTDGLILLSDLKEVAWRLDMPSQMLFATTTNAHLLPTILQVRPPRLADVPIESGLGATLNYDISATNTGTQNSGTGAFDMRVFSPWGVASTDFLAFSGGGPAVSVRTRAAAARRSRNAAARPASATAANFANAGSAGPAASTRAHNV